MGKPLRVVHYLNQYFGGVGGEEEANAELRVAESAEGSARALVQAMGDDGSLAATIICGDNYFSDQNERAVAALTDALRAVQPDVVVAGPAFDAGRYGLACAQVCQVASELGIAAVAGMDAENPAVDMYARDIMIVPSGAAPRQMLPALKTMWALACKLGLGEPRGPAAVDGYIPTGERRPVAREEPGSKRAVDMLLTKLAGREFQTEVPYRAPERVSPAPPLADLGRATIALITSGGLIPKGNPDGAAAAGGPRYYRRSIEDLDSLEPVHWEAFHVGYFNEIVSGNPNYVLPLAPMRELETRGEIGKVFDSMFTLAGVGTPVARAKELGEGIADELKDGGVDGVLLVAT
jgi:glycine reductase